MPTIPIRLRDREVLDAQLDQCRQVDNSFTRGAAAGLRWLTAGGPGPLTGTLATSIDFQSIVRELAVAEDIIFGSPSPGRDYARGLEHALLWAENATAGPPVPDSERADRRTPDVHKPVTATYATATPTRMRVTAPPAQRAISHRMPGS